MAKIHTQCPRIESPCPQTPAFARGAKVSFCDLCQKNVHNLSAMTAAERRRLMQTEAAPCVRYVHWVPLAAVLLSAAGNAPAQDAQAEDDSAQMEQVVIVGGGIRDAAFETVFMETEVETDESWLDDESAGAP